MEAETVIDTQKFYDCLIENNIDFFCGVPDSLLKELCLCIKDNSHNNIICANEGNAIALAAGYHISTSRYGCVYMQNSGLGNAINPLLSLSDNEVYSIPVLMIIGWRGEPGVHDEPQHIKQGKVTLSLLDTVGIKYLIVDEDYESQISECYKYMKETNNSIALIVRKNAFSKYSAESDNSDYLLTREEAIEVLVSRLGDNDFIVSTTGKASRELYEIRERNNQTHANDFLTVGSMGHTSSLALGISLGTNKNVYCLDGDGSFIMHMGSLGVVADNCRDNFKYIMINNGSHDSVGGQPTIGFDIDIKNILLGLGFENVVEARSREDIIKHIEVLKENKSAMIIYCKKGSRKDLGRPSTAPKDNKKEFIKKISEVNSESNYI